MSYFLPSSLQKRILRYALSRLELLDTDALDLEKLDIVWGRKSTIELRDVGINIEKVAALLKLPPALLITRANISTMRVTVPADLYQSSIVLEIDGVDVGLMPDILNGDEAGKKKEKASQRGPRTPSRRSQADRPRNTQPLVHDPGGSPNSGDSGDNEDTHLPTTLDLAQSFVQAEPIDERSELKAAVAHSLYLSQSQNPNEDDLDASEVGMGNEISLPGFLAAYLKGVGDRVEVRIKDFKVDLNVKLANKDESQWAEDVRIRLAVGHVAVGAVSLGHEGKQTRRIATKNIQLVIISEQSLFSNLARSTAPSSPETGQESAVLTARSKSHQSSPSLKDENLPAMPTDEMEQGIADLRESQASVVSAQDGAVSEGDYSKMRSRGSLAEYGGTVGSLHGGDTFSDSFYSSKGHGSFYHEETERSKPFNFALDPSKEYDRLPSRQSSLGSEALQPFAELQESPLENFNAFPSPSFHESCNRDNTTSFASTTQYTRTPGTLTEDPNESPVEFRSPEDVPSSPSFEDLTESKIFSHEQRESMYMSAMSGNASSPNDSKLRIPGSWESSTMDKESSNTMLKPEVDAGLQEITTRPGNGEFDGAMLISDHNIDRSGTPTNLLHGDEQVQSNPASRIDPALGTGSIASGNFTSSPQGSGSPSSSRKDPLILAKRILLIDSINVELPNEGSETSSQFSSEIDPRVPPEVFPPAKPEHGLVASSIVVQRHERGQLSSSGVEQDPPKPATAITIGNVQVVGDVGLTKLTVLLVEKLSSVYQPPLPSKRKMTSAGPHITSRCLLNVESVSWKFLDLVRGAFTPDSAPLEALPAKTALSEGADILLSSNINHLHLDYTRSEHTSQSKVFIDGFSIGYMDDDILSFDAGLKMRGSTRDVSAFTDKDIVLTIVETNGILSFDITTLPIHVVLDLRRLDETFSWFGGFSSMLGLGSSMMSTVTLLDPTTKAFPSGTASRGVHFDSTVPSQAPRRGTTNKQKKITARIGGLKFDLRGAKTAICLDSTAMKLVSRTEGVGIQIDRLILSGPITENPVDDCPISAKVANVRIEYLTTPKENDLTRLLTLLGPSKDTYKDEDDILVDTLIRQRKKGGVLRATIESVDAHLSDMQAFQCFPRLAEEAKKLSTVAKYLPEDDRPGLLTLLLIKSLKVEAHINDKFGVIECKATHVEVANITFPTLTALGISDLHFSRNTAEELLGRALGSKVDTTVSKVYPMIMARFIGNEMEPIVKIKVYGACFEYHVSTIVAIRDLKDGIAAEELVSDMISSLATLTSRKPPATSPSQLLNRGSMSSNTSSGSRALKFDVAFRDTILGLNARGSKAKGLIVLTDTHFVGSMPFAEDANASLEIRRAELMVTDDLSSLLEPEIRKARQTLHTPYTQVQALAETGYVSVSQISAANVAIQIVRSKLDSGPTIDVEIRDNLFVLESCADSTQTLIDLLNGLKPPMPKSTALKYQTEVVPVEDMLASFSGEAFEMSKIGPINKTREALDLDEDNGVDEEAAQNLEFVSSFYNPGPESPGTESAADSMFDDDFDSIATPSILRELGDNNHLESFQEQDRVAPSRPSLDFQDDHFGPDSIVGGVAHRWDPKQGTYSPSKNKIHECPLRIRMRDVHIIWNLFDGYDWQRTRDTIGQAVAEVQNKAIERQLARKRKSLDPEEEDEDVIGDFLFNSIYIGIPAKHDPADLARQVNQNIDDLVSEPGSYATSTSGGASPNRAQLTKPRSKRLRLQRSKYHKLTFELKGVSADVVVFPPGSGETESSIDIRVQDLEIFDHVPTSTWKKFATYMHDAGERESGTSMIHIEILNVKPVPNLAASEIVLKVGLQMLVFTNANRFTGICSPTSPPCGPRRPGLYDPLLRFQGQQRAEHYL